LCQISIITSHPVVNEGEQKQDVFYRDNANSSVIREENALHRNAGSSDRWNGTLLGFLSEHARVARNTHGCVKNEPPVVVRCGKDLIRTVSCKKRSAECYGQSSDPAPRCKEIILTCPQERNKVMVTGCECL